MSLTAESLYQMEQINSADFSPDGSQVVFTVQRVDEKTEQKHNNLYVVATDGESKPRRFTYGDWSDSQPRWSPDGSAIAFMSNRGNPQQQQLYVLPLNGGEARPVTTLQGSMMFEYAWSPDGSKFFATILEMDDDVKERMADEQKKKLGVVAHHITDVQYKFDGQGFLPKNNSQLWIIDVESGEATQLTDLPNFVNSPAWSPDGSEIVFTVNLHEDPSFHPEAAQLYSVSAEPRTKMEVVESDEEDSDEEEEQEVNNPYRAEDLLQLTEHEGPLFAPSFSPDGSQIALYGKDGKRDWWRNTSVYVMAASGGKLKNLTEEHDLDVGSNTLNDVNGTAPNGRPVWSADGKAVYVTVSRHGQQPLIKLDVESAEKTTIIEQGIIGVFGFNEDESRVAYFKGEPADPGQLFVRDVASGEETQLTGLNDWLKEATTSYLEEVWFESADGYKVQGWILYPPDFDPEQTYPSILEIHGGPQTQYGAIFMHEFHYLANNGYVVYFCNPRGGQGYGNDHAQAIHGQWGTVDYQDVMAWADYMEQQPFIDTERMGVTGGSYGGYMTTWIIGHTDRFKAAVAQRSVTNWTSMWGTADFNWGWIHLTGDPHPFEDIETNWNHSPIAHLHNATTPTLFIHSLADYRTNFEQSEQAFVMLKVRGVETEMLAVPDESHGLSRGGRTDRRIARLTHMLRWFDKYLM